MMKNWRDVNTRNRVSVLARQLVKSVKGDLTTLYQSQRDMLAAVAMRDRGLSIEDAMTEFGGARSSIGFARTILRFTDPQISAIVLAGLMSLHVVERMRREMGSRVLLSLLLSLTDEQITKRYASKRAMPKTRRADHTRTRKNTSVLIADTYSNPAPELTPRQLAGQKGGRARWAKAKANKAVTGLPIVPVEAPAIAEWNSTSINRALKVITTARDLAQVGDITGARQLLKVVGMALQEA